MFPFQVFVVQFPVSKFYSGFRVDHQIAQATEMTSFNAESAAATSDTGTTLMTSHKFESAAATSDTGTTKMTSHYEEKAAEVTTSQTENQDPNRATSSDVSLKFWSKVYTSSTNTYYEI